MVQLNLQSTVKKLKAHGSVRITEKELRELISIPDYNEYYNSVLELINNKIITPVKSSGANGMRPPLHKRYTIVKPEESYDELIPEIRLLHSTFNIEGYLTHPEKYKSHNPWLMILDDFLKNNAKDLEIPLSINERSFQIFKKEKALKEDQCLITVLNFNPNLRGMLNFYNTPEPFFVYNATSWETEVSQENFLKRQELNILVIENKDTWYTMKNCMTLNRSYIDGIRFDSLIFGEGKKISRKIDSLTEFDSSFFNGRKTTYYYFGDLDHEGIGIIHDLISTNPMLKIRIMKQLYAAMLETSKGLELPVMKEKQSKKAVDWFVSLFAKEQQCIINKILESGRYIPQEILNNGHFIKMIDSKGA